MSLQFDGKVALITGAGSGMGRAISLEFASAGASIVALDLDEETANATVQSALDLGAPQAVAISANVASEEAVAIAVRRALDEFPKIDILINNAGIFDSATPLLECDPGLWNRVLGVNLYGPYFVTRAVLPNMIEGGGGVIVNTASIASHVAGAGGAAYTTSKHAILGFTKQLALDYAKQGVRVNAICPGSIDTNLTKPLFEADPELLASNEALPAGRIGTAAEVAKLVRFLASDDAAFIVGTGVVIDGGWTLT